MATYIPQISRCLSYNAPICRPHRLLHGSCKHWKKICTNYVTWQPPMMVEIRPHVSPTRVQVQFYSKVFTFNTDMNVLRKRINPRESPEEIVCNVVPVGIIVPEDKDGQNMKIVIVPLDVKNLDKNALETTLSALKQLRDHAHEIEDFTDKMIDDYRKESEVGEQQEQQRAMLDEVNFLKNLDSQDVNAVGNQAGKVESEEVKQGSKFVELSSLEQRSYKADVAPMTPSPATTPNLPNSPNTVPVNPNNVPNTVPQTQPSVLPLGDPNQTQISAKDPDAANSDFITMDVPNSLSEDLDKMAISSMKLSFEMNMTDVREAMVLGENAMIKPTPSLGDDAIVYFETKVEADSKSQPINTVPLQFNALINGTVQIDTDKLTADQLTDANVTEYQDSVTSIAANICTTALQKNFLKEVSGALAANPNPEQQDVDMLAMPWFAYLKEQPVMNVQPEPDVIHDKDGCKHPVVKPKKKCPKKCPDLDDPCKEDKCTPPKKPQKPKSEQTMQIMASASKGKDPCAKKGDAGGAKKDPCAKGGGKGGKDGKDGKKDPCAKFKGKNGGGGGKKADPCGKGGGKGGKDGKDGKKDPCAQFKSKGKNGGGGKKADPCGKGGKDGKDGKNGKKDPCAQFKSKGKNGGKKADPCGKGGGKGGDKGKGKDPCAQFKKSGGGDKCKKYSTIASPVTKFYHSNSCFKPKRTLCTCLQCSLSKYLRRPRLPRFKMYRGKFSEMQLQCWGLDAKRYYGKDEDHKSKCNALSTKPRSRKDKKARTTLRTDCDKSTECGPKTFVVKCQNVKTPRKKCPKDNKQLDPPKIPKKPKKKPSPICLAYKKNEKESPAFFGSQGDVLQQTRRYVSQVKTFEITKDYDEDDKHDDKKTMMEVITIPVSYHICKERMKIPSLRPYDVLLSTGAVALTGSDIHVYENANEDIEDITLGHDATGYVVDIGKSVKNLHVGDRVVVEAALSCGLCEYCKRGECNLCPELVYNGFLASHQTHPADLCHRLPDTVSMEDGALTQTLAMGCQACFKANISPTSNLLIIGTTPTAVSAAICAASMGATKIMIADSKISNLERIKYDFGFDTILYDTNAHLDEVLEAVQDKFTGWPDSVINCAIAPMTMNLAVMALQPSSVCVLSECESECSSFNAFDVLMKNIRLIPSFRTANMYPMALELMKSGQAPMGKFIARVFPWCQLEMAFQQAQHESNTGLRKIVVQNI